MRDALHRLFSFYRLQLELVLDSRRGRWLLLRRAIVSFIVAFGSLGLTAALLPGLAIPFPVSLALAVLVIGGLSALVRPILLSLVAPRSLTLVFVVAIAFQVLVIMALVPLVPGVVVTGWSQAFLASWVFAIINSLATWLLSLDSDDSYYAMLIRRVISQRPNVIRSAQPGLVIVQIDGLAHPVLTRQLRAGRVPVIARWLRSGEMRLDRWTTLLPSQTSASQAGIMYGNNDDIPAFRWWDKAAGRLFVSNRPDDAATLDERAGAGTARGLLAEGASVGNLLSGGARRSYLTMATVSDRSQGLGKSESYFSFFLSPYAYAHAIVLGLAEVAKELFQSRRARVMGIEPRLERRFPYPLLRSLTNVVLRPLCTSLVMEEMMRGTPVIYVTYTDYDEIAHYSGPERGESLDALDGVDRALGSLQWAARDAPRPYRFVVLSDHGQSLGATFRQRFGLTIEQVVQQLMGGRASVEAATQQLEQWGMANAFLTEVGQAGGTTGALARRAMGRRRLSEAVDAAGPEEAATDRPVEEPPELMVCASGNLALIFFPRLPGRVSLEQLDELYPNLVEALANHPGIGLLMVRSAERGALAVSRRGAHRLAEGTVSGTDPLAGFGDHAAAALQRLDAMGNCGDLVLISALDPETDEVAAFEELIGSHGGLGGAQTEGVLLHPADWPSGPEALLGAPALHDQLRSWLEAIQPASD